MKVGLFALSIGTGARPLTIRRTAETAERTGFSTLWVGEHVVLFDEHASRYPYSQNGQFPVASDSDWLDPFATLTYAAAFTSRIRLATGICLLPEHNPLVLAKQVASLDQLCGGRFTFGVGVGWLAEEFAALGVPFERRAQRAVEYLAVMRKLWTESITTFDGEFVKFKGVRSFPKPPQNAKLPVFFGGESAPALRRAAEHGNGWFGFNLDPGQTRAKVAKLHAMMRARGRDPRELDVAISPYSKRIAPHDLEGYRDAGVSEVVIVASPPQDESQVGAWVERLAEKWVEPAAKL
jgi:probable F420-dependent oxidoreductase